ncbi:hypothetical protein [Nonomuraea diastatica]|uniref:Uncharacterized protein n=1 Tax=Nonomuraea diastatica TaxID=1848329 RepID=A0A4R4W691_9ACTN|nr:hypothetical protein [Nonomuraea diastatica]TDD14112.1 hypothetical protein E1294_38730 [Nonomuraea diastatica]
MISSTPVRRSPWPGGQDEHRAAVFRQAIADDLRMMIFEDHVVATYYQSPPLYTIEASALLGVPTRRLANDGPGAASAGEAGTTFARISGFPSGGLRWVASGIAGLRSAGAYGGVDPSSGHGGRRRAATRVEPLPGDQAGGELGV